MKKIFSIVFVLFFSSVLLAQFGGKSTWVYGKIQKADAKKLTIEFVVDDGMVITLKATKDKFDKIKGNKKVMKVAYKQQKDASFTLEMYELNPAPKSAKK
jgi:hypothetical protein